MGGNRYISIGNQLGHLQLIGCSGVSGWLETEGSPMKEDGLQERAPSEICPRKRKQQEKQRECCAMDSFATRPRSLREP